MKPIPVCNNNCDITWDWSLVYWCVLLESELQTGIGIESCSEVFPREGGGDDMLFDGPGIGCRHEQGLVSRLQQVLPDVG